MISFFQGVANFFSTVWDWFNQLFSFFGTVHDSFSACWSVFSDIGFSPLIAISGVFLSVLLISKIVSKG